MSGSPGKHSFENHQYLLETPYDFGLDADQKTKKIEKNEKELSGSPGKQNLLTLSTLPQKRGVFRIDAAQKTKKTHKNVKVW